MTDQTLPAGATPAAAGATPTQTTPVSPAAEPPVTAPTTPATGDPDALGDAGKRALDAMKTERDAAVRDRKAADQALADLKLAGASDAEKAIAAAKAEGASEVTNRWAARIRQSELKAALAAAGINAGVLDYVVRGDEFAGLAVSDEGVVDGIPAAVEAFKKAHADLFTKPAAPGSADGGVRGQPGLTREQVKAMTPAEYAKRRDEVLAFMEAEAKK